MSFSGAFVSSNQGEFDWVKCTADECEYWNAEDASNNAPATSPASYLQSVGMFAAVSVVMAVLSPLFITCCCLWRMCGCCGGWTPTYWMTKTGNPRCCKCGFRRRLNPLLADEDKFAYPTLQVTLIRIFAICVAILLLYVCAVAVPDGCGVHASLLTGWLPVVQCVHRCGPANGQCCLHGLHGTPCARSKRYGRHHP